MAGISIIRSSQYNCQGTQFKKTVNTRHVCTQEEVNALATGHLRTACAKEIVEIKRNGMLAYYPTGYPVCLEANDWKSNNMKRNLE